MIRYVITRRKLCSRKLFALVLYYTETNRFFVLRISFIAYIKKKKKLMTDNNNN